MATRNHLCRRGDRCPLPHPLQCTQARSTNWLNRDKIIYTIKSNCYRLNVARLSENWDNAANSFWVRPFQLLDRPQCSVHMDTARRPAKGSNMAYMVSGYITLQFNKMRSNTASLFSCSTCTKESKTSNMLKLSFALGWQWCDAIHFQTNARQTAKRLIDWLTNWMN